METATAINARTGRLVELLQQLIRNGCVSRGYPSEGEESRNAETIEAALDGPGLELARLEPVPGRASLVARIEGTDPDAPSLCLLGHTDVVPVEPSSWSRDPFGGELVDGEVWGRGAVDMLNQTAAMALAMRGLADRGFRPRGTLVYAAVPDEECGGEQGIKLLLEQHRDLLDVDYAVTEIGGAVRSTPSGSMVECYVAEKGGGTIVVHVKGTAAHSSVPWGSDNALVTAAEVIRRLTTYRPRTEILPSWVSWVEAQGFAPEVEAVLLDPDRLHDALGDLPPVLAGRAHACTHNTVAPTMLQAGTKINVIPGVSTLGVNVRILPGQDPEELVADLRELLADLGDRIELEPMRLQAGSGSPVDTPLWDALEHVARRHHPDAVLVPSLCVGATDARWLRPVGIPTYGFGVLSRKVTPTAYWSRFHSHDERIDVESLAMSLSGWEQLAGDFLS
jgi:acetylornithine deacetylase/succinyl-diaminopimelate desuccinylase-like protein